MPSGPITIAFMKSICCSSYLRKMEELHRTGQRRLAWYVCMSARAHACVWLHALWHKKIFIKKTSKKNTSAQRYLLPELSDQVSKVQHVSERSGGGGGGGGGGKRDEGA